MKRKTTEDRLESERSKDYGDPATCHSNIALAWNAYMSQRIAAGQINLADYDVANMMALLKIIRAGFNPGHDDSYDDARVYLGFAKRFGCKGFDLEEIIREENQHSGSSPASPFDDPRDREADYVQSVSLTPQQKVDAVIRSRMDTGIRDDT